MILFNVCDIVDIGKSQDKGGYTFHMCKYWRALALLVNERGALLVKLSDVIAAGSKSKSGKTVKYGKSDVFITV